MRILGISGGFGHDAAACLLVDGKMIAAAEEERFTRIKTAPGSVPIQSTLYCLSAGKCELSDIDLVAVGWDPNLDPSAEYLSDSFWRFYSHEMWSRTRIPPFKYIPHHLAHAASAFFGSGYRDAAIIVLDGNGENVSTTLATGHGTEISIHRQFGITNSLGQFYTKASEFAGLGTHGEGKLMGLSAFGEPRYDFPIRLTNGGYEIDLPNVDALSAAERFARLGESWHSQFAEIVGAANQRRHYWDVGQSGVAAACELTPRERDFTASVQACLTETILHLVRVLVGSTGKRDVVLAGGVGLNCNANGAILRSGLVDNLYIFPAAHDAGVAVGAAFQAAAEHNELSAIPVDHAYWGPCFGDESIKKLLDDFNLRYDSYADVTPIVAEALSMDKVVGWFQGRMELGPRALGNRSILASPSGTDIRDRVNSIKRREEWRPLSPSIRQHLSARLLEHGHASPFMLVFDRVRAEWQERLAGVVHVDGTCRAQSVCRETNELYWRLLSCFEETTGVPALLNTSFNVGHEPIVCTPLDAIRTFFASGIDVLCMGNHVLTK